jgi:hypothetical protein
MDPRPWLPPLASTPMFLFDSPLPLVLSLSLLSLSLSSAMFRWGGLRLDFCDFFFLVGWGALNFQRCRFWYWVRLKSRFENTLFCFCVFVVCVLQCIAVSVYFGFVILGIGLNSVWLDCFLITVDTTSFCTPNTSCMQFFPLPFPPLSSINQYTNEYRFP